ncbi:G-protein coupled estrogen receptor 1 [Liparis tanakae]|uniref:G-protein coupled estrogen receptor 1 n=1 Tax=Liparis tanakae TaxID=230148 RepID=A0A4Z2FH85_9TELE|nr:G-protein coupled estrogen receptor 1 [Liparis tanakae]
MCRDPGGAAAQVNDTKAAVSGLLEAAASGQLYLLSLLLSSLYIIFLFPVGLLGNLLILVVNLKHAGCMTAPDLYFVNLAAADLALVADSLIEVFNLRRGYYERPGLCTFMNLFQQANMYSSVFFLTWMSFDRFVALTGFMRRSVRRARLSCCLIWVSSSLLTVLPFAIAQKQHVGEPLFCFADVTQIQWLEVMLSFVLPLGILGLCYWRIARVLRQSQRGPDGARRPPGRQKALRMISAAVLVFFLCWLPENVFITYHLLRGDAAQGSLWHDYPLTGHAVRLAAFSNSCLNPLVYSFLGETFQEKLRGRWATLQRSASGKHACVPTASPAVPAKRHGPGQATPLSSALLPGAALLPSDKHQLPRVGQDDDDHEQLGPRCVDLVI